MTIELRSMFTRRAVRAILMLCVVGVCAMTAGLVISQGRPTDKSESDWKTRRETRDERLFECMKSDEQRQREAQGTSPLLDPSFPEEFRDEYEARASRVPTFRALTR